MSKRLITLALSFQILLAFFSPPIPWGERLVFPADVWALVWTAVCTLWIIGNGGTAPRAQTLRTVAWIFIPLLVVFLHGNTRPSLAPAFSVHLTAPSDDLFHPTREFIIFIRFFAWGLGAWLTSRLSLNRQALTRCLAGCAALSALSMIAGALGPDIRTGLATLYRYDPNVADWTYRSYGTFRSPVEASATLSFSLLLLLQERWAGRAIRVTVATVVLSGILVSQTITSFLAVVVALVWVRLRSLAPATRWAWVGGIGLALTLILVLSDLPFVTSKRGNLLFRMKPWAIYWDAATSRGDRFLLGLGFHPHFSDSIYVFLFSRGGVLLLGLSAYGAVRLWMQRRASWTPLQKAIPTFFVISGLTTDSLIIRPVTYVLIAVGVPILFRRETELTPPQSPELPTSRS